MADHPIFAALYDRMCAPAEAAGLADARRRLLEGATGRVLEVGGGTGHNLPYYHSADEVVVIEPDGAMRRRLEPRLEQCPVPARVVSAGIDDADLEPASFDSVVSTLTLCTVPDLGRALTRIRSLLAPDGKLLFLEHVRATGLRGRMQHGLTPLWSRLVPGCHLDREVTAGLRGAGFVVSRCDRLDLPMGPLLAVGVAGEARPRAVAA